MKEISKEEMTRLYYDAILAHCNRKLNYEIDAARDITQEVFYELFSHWDGFQSHAEAGLLTWLYRTADILVKKYFRLQKKAKKMESMQNANCIDFDFEVDSALLAKEEKQQYEAYIAEIKENLSDKELQIFEHIILQKYTVSQTARLCVIFILFSAFSVTAIAVGGFNEAWGNIAEFVSELLNLSPGTYDGDGFTLIKGNSSSRFDSVEALLQEEELKILYPANLPENIKIEKITIIEIENDRRVYFNFNIDDLTMLSKAIGKQIDDPERLRIINEFACYVDQYDGKYQATFYHENREYTIVHSNYEELVEIIENLTYFN